MFFDNETIVSLPTPYLKLIGAYIYANMNFRIGIGRNISYRPIYWILYSFMNLYSKIQIQVYYNFFLYFNFSELLFTKGIFFFALLVSASVLADNKISIIGIYQYQNEKKANQSTAASYFPSYYPTYSQYNTRGPNRL